MLALHVNILILRSTLTGTPLFAVVVVVVMMVLFVVVANSIGRICAAHTRVVGVMKFSESASRVVPQWYCKTSFFETFPKLLQSTDDLHGKDSLSTRDQAWIAESIRAELASDEEYIGASGGGDGGFINDVEDISSDDDEDDVVVVEDLTKDEIEDIE